MPKLPPHVQAAVDELLAVAPPLSPAQKRAIQTILGPVVRDLARQGADRLDRRP